MSAIAEETARRENPLSALLRETSDLFSNFWFGMSLLAVWGVMTLIGVVVDQGKDPTAYFNEYPAPIARAILRLHLDDIYHSAAYVGMIGLIIGAMTFATFKAVIPRRIPRLHPVKIDKIPLHATIDVADDTPTVRERVAAFFAARGFEVRKREFGGDEWTFADKHNWARRGVLVAHVGFVIIAVGTTMYWFWGYSGQTAILSGQTATIKENGTKIHLDRFGYRIDPITTKSGVVYQPIDYVSHVQVTANGKTTPMTIRVNHPIDVDGVTYYQSSYGFAIQFVLTKNGAPVPGFSTAPVLQGAGFGIPGTNRAIQYAQFVGTIDNKTGMPAADPRPFNPGVVVAAFDGETPAGRALIPLGKAIDLGNGYALGAERYVVYTGIQYRHDPGVALVLIGALVLLAGLCISFYFLPARLFVQVTPEGEGTRIGIAATTVKGYDLFAERFREIVATLQADESRSAGHSAPTAAAATLGPVELGSTRR